MVVVCPIIFGIEADRRAAFFKRDAAAGVIAPHRQQRQRHAAGYRTEGGDRPLEHTPQTRKQPVGGRPVNPESAEQLGDDRLVRRREPSPLHVYPLGLASVAAELAERAVGVTDVRREWTTGKRERPVVGDERWDGSPDLGVRQQAGDHQPERRDERRPGQEEVEAGDHQH